MRSVSESGVKEASFDVESWSPQDFRRKQPHVSDEKTTPKSCWKGVERVKTSCAQYLETRICAEEEESEWFLEPNATVGGVAVLENRARRPAQVQD